MGLDCSHGAWHGSYTAFGRWRREIARLCGIPLDFMEGFYSSNPDSNNGIMLLLRVIEHDEQRMLEVQGYPRRPSKETHAESVRRVLAPFPLLWGTLRYDPIHHLLNHSDSEGDISPHKCRLIADRLEQLLPLLPKEDDWGHIGNWQQKTQQFIDGCRLAAAAGEPLRFE